MRITTPEFIQSFLKTFIVEERCLEYSGAEIIWVSLKKKLKDIYGESTYNSWLSSLKFVKEENSQLFFKVPSEFIKEWINTNYSSKILNLWRQENSNIYSIEITVDKTSNTTVIPPSVENVISNVIVDKHELQALSAPLNPSFTFDNFVVGKPNELAFAAAKQIAESSHPLPGSNPFFLCAEVGRGKTHLMQAIAWYIKNNFASKKVVVYISAEKFMYQYITALRNKSIMAFKEQFRSVDVLMVDDVQFISGKDSTQEEFFHTFNALIEQNKQLVISADRSPSDLHGVEERIKSRLGWGLVVDINDTTFELRVGILQSKVASMKLHVPIKVLEFIAKNIVSNVRELEGALNKVVANSSLLGKPITLDSTKEILTDLLRCNEKIICIDDIIKKVCDYFNVKAADLRSDRRLRHITRIRQMAMYLSKTLTQKSLPEIGRKFGDRDHTTVIHSIKKVESLMAEEPQIREDVEMLMKILK